MTLPLQTLSPGNFADAIDSRHEAERSIVLRYRNAVRLEPEETDDARLKEILERTSLQEGLRIVPLFVHQGVEVDVLDETSRMHTHTLKSIDGCLTTAQCLLRGHRRTVFESGGNTGTALTAYGARAGIETFFFVPAENLPLLDGRTFAAQTARVIAVDDPRQVKPAAGAFAARHDLPRVPALGWRIQASTFTGCFLLEHFLAHRPYDVLAQSISAAFGPVGIYRILGQCRDEIGPLPAFLGVQQAANCPMVRAWRANGRAEHWGRAEHRGAAPAAAGPVESTAGLLARVMYDGEPETYATFQPLRDILIETDGDLVTIDRDDFRCGLWTVIEGASALDHLAARGIPVTLRDGEVLEKAGLMALAATVREIETGRIPAGSRVLVCITGGTARPEGRVNAARWNGSDVEGLS